jgi:aldehyde:ferredoxin oxidoreductase
MVRGFNIQEGLRREDDRLPSRLYKEALKSGHRISEGDLDRMLTDYYRLRGWDENGRPISDSKKLNQPKIARSPSLLHG